MKMLALALTVLLLLANCPYTAECPEHGVSSNPTGRYKQNGATEYAEFSHILTDGSYHRFWERCN